MTPQGSTTVTVRATQAAQTVQIEPVHDAIGAARGKLFAPTACKISISDKLSAVIESKFRVAALAFSGDDAP